MKMKILIFVLISASIPTFNAATVTKVENDYYERITANIEQFKQGLSEFANFDDEIQRQLMETKDVIVSIYEDYRDKLLMPIDTSDIELVINLLTSDRQTVENLINSQSKLERVETFDNNGNLTSIEIFSNNRLLVRSNFENTREIKRELYANNKLTRSLEYDSTNNRVVRTDYGNDSNGNFMIKRMFYENDTLQYAILYNRDQTDYMHINLIQSPDELDIVMEYNG